MQRRGDQLVFSASDLNNYLECEHLTQLDLQVARGALERPSGTDASAELVARKGDEHEARCLERLVRQGRQVVTIEQDGDEVAATVEAMKAGTEVIYQGAFEHEGWVGFADFLFRIDEPSALGAWSYEVADAKLAHSSKPYHVLQLCFYSEHVARIQGREPVQAHLLLGNGEEVSLRLDEYAAYYRSVRERFLAEIGRGPDTYPMPCAHCAVCRWNDHCTAQRERDDHLSLVAEIRRSQIQRLEEAGISTMAALAAAPTPLQVSGIGGPTAERLRAQAALQVHKRETGEDRYEVLPIVEGRGFALLPPPSDGDVFFDMEGNPFADGGLEYLFGAVTVDTGEPVFTDFWAHTRVEEKRAFESFVDFVTERRRRWPDLHVYHYAPYEPTALKRLAGAHGTREDEVDDLLRHGVLVDLYAVVRNGVRVSQPSYSIKKLEPFYMEERGADIKDAGSSVVAYEEWLETRDPAILEQIREYNREDCVSTWKLSGWLRERAREAEELFGPSETEPPEVKDPDPEALARSAERAAVAAELLEGVPEAPEERSPEQQARWLLAQLIDWHRREERPEWWAFFDKFGKNEDELIDDAECIGDVTLDESAPIEREKQSLVYTLRFPAQDHKIGRGQGYDPTTLKAAGTILEVRDAEGIIRFKRGKARATEPLPTAFMPPPPIDSKTLSAAVLRVAKACTAGVEEGGPYGAVRDLLLRRPPRVYGHQPGTPLIDEQGDALQQLLSVGERLHETTLFIQGPPGAGKTYSAARLIVHLIKLGRRVGVSAFTHKAIHNLLAEVEECARQSDVKFRGVKKGSEEEAYEGEFITSVAEPEEVVAMLDDVQLVAGTAWLFARETMKGAVDTLFIDEAGQISLANVVAVGGAARNLVLIGDPAQLAQPSKGTHPDGAGVSGLEHLLAGRRTIPPAEGVFLGVSWRMHPDVCAFISETMYEGRLHSSQGAARQYVAGDDLLCGAGIRFLPVSHAGNTQRSTEEAEAVREVIAALVGRTFVDREGQARALAVEDILVVTPYNAQVRCLRDVLPEGARVGTVDKFQGQEAPVVVFSMATSSGEEVPRTLDFLFSKNRLNVAISRAQALAVLVASPALFRVRCKTLTQMRLTSTFCRLLEHAQPTRG